MPNFGFNIPDSLKRNGSGSPFGRPPPSSDPPAQQPQGSAPGFTSVFNKSSFSKTLPTINANSSQAPTRVFGSNMANNSFSAGFPSSSKPFSSAASASNGGFLKGAIGQQNSNGPPTSSVGLPHNTKQQLMNVLGEKLQKSSAESLFNRKPLPTAPTFSHFKQQSAGSSTSPAKAKGSSHMDGSKKSFDGFGGPRSKGASTGFNFKHRSPLVNRFEAQEQMAGSSSNGRNIEAALKKAGAIHRVENRQNRAAVNNVWMDSPMASALRTSKGTTAGAQPISAMEPKKRRSSDDMALALRARRNLLERTSSNEGKSPATAAAMAIKRRNMRLPAQRNRQVANEMGAPKAIPRADRSEAAIPASSMMHLSRLQSLPKVDSSQSMKASSKEDVVQQLRSLIGTYCETNVEKYQILKKRDELMYKTRTKNTDVSVMDITQGKCPDMCPEKERYMRETQKNLNRYECDLQGDMVPSLTVKDYSRSAADQEEPLPHELRPPHVLQMTMNYLMNKIANEIPSNSSDLVKWYDFLWSRTRSIRKDITQQMLNDKVAVDLVEKCARLHVFASFRLSSLDIADFNQKMNSENLSKCLQTLRHMYDDLAAEGIFCSSESEFRSYDMILNLADSNVHGQVLSYREEVRQSTEVQLALTLATSLQNNNYVQFFRQLRNHASFLQACLCQRYFPMVRHSSLKTICSAYRLFPLDRFIDILAFDNSTDAIEFLLAFGIEMDQADESYIDVTEGRSIFAGRAPDPESLAIGCSAWLEMKIGGRPLAEVLSNGPCEDVQIPQPVNSFDTNHCYTRDPFNSISGKNTQQREGVDKQQSISKLVFSSATSTLAKEPAISQEAKPSFSFAKPTLNLLPETNKPTSVFSSNLFSISKPKLASSGFVDNSKLQQPSPFSFVSNSAVDAPATKPAFLSASVFGQKLPLTSNLGAQPSTVWSQVQSNGDSKSSLPMFAANPETCQQKIPSQLSAIETEAKLEEERKAVAKAEAETKRKAEIKARQQAEIAKQKAEMEARRKKEELKLVAEQFIDSQVKLILESLVQRELETIAAEIREEAELFQSRLTRFQDNLFNMWLRQFTDQWKSIVKRNKLLRSISLRQQEGLIIAKARRSIAELCSPSNSTMPQPKRRRITAEQMELCLYARHYNAVRTKQLAKVYFAKWRQYVVNRRKRSYFESFFIQATYMGSYENGKWTKRSQQSEE